MVPLLLTRDLFTPSLTRDLFTPGSQNRYELLTLKGLSAEAKPNFGIVPRTLGTPHSANAQARQHMLKHIDAGATPLEPQSTKSASLPEPYRGPLATGFSQADGVNESRVKPRRRPLGVSPSQG